MRESHTNASSEFKKTNSGPYCKFAITRARISRKILEIGIIYVGTTCPVQYWVSRRRLFPRHILSSGASPDSIKIMLYYLYSLERVESCKAKCVILIHNDDDYVRINAH